MKTIKYFIAGFILMVTGSCGNDWLNLDPSTEIDTETSIQKLLDIEFTLNGIYSTMQSSDAYSGRLIYYGDVTGDDMQACSATKRTGNYYLFNFTKDSNPTSHWSYLYAIIQNCNIILMNIDKLTIEDSDKSYRDDLKGQALALRGMAMFDLLRFFCYPYMKDNGASMGVPIVKDLSDINSKPARSTVAKCYEEVTTDLDNATKLLGETFSKGKINKWGAYTLLSRAYLYIGKNSEAFNAATAAIDGAKSNDYKLWSNKDYPTAWASDASALNPGEVLFELVNLTSDSPGKESMGYLSSYDGYADLSVTASFYKLMRSDPNDVRNKLIIVDEDKEFAFVNKYQPQEGENITDANIPLIRLSEAYLNAAEAAVKMGNKNDDAVKYLDPIVSRANPDNTVKGTTITLDRVLEERRKEFFDEGHRMFDVIRNGRTVKRIDTIVKELSDTEHFANDMEYDWNFYKIILPIPKKEMDANPNMKQNPGYGD